MADTALHFELTLAPAPDPPLRAIQQRDSMRALGMAVHYLMRQPSFAAMPFGHWARTLVGQINRRHYLFVVRGEEIVGFVGWALTSQQNGEAWITGRGDIPSREATTGDCMIVNAWQANSKEVNAFLLNQLRQSARNVRMVYAKRYYIDGRWRPVKLRVNPLIAEP